MEEILSEVLAFTLAYHVQILLPLMLFGFDLQKRKSWLWVIIPCSVAYLALPKLYSQITGFEIWICEQLQFFGWYNISYVIYWMIAMVIFYFTFQTTAKSTLFYGIAAYTIQSLGSNTRNICRVVLSLGTSGLLVRVIGCMITAVILLLYYFILVKRLRQSGANDMLNNGSLIAFLLIVLFVVNIFSQYWGYTTMLGGYYPLDLNGMVFTAICTLILLVLQFGIFQRSQLKYDKIIMEQIIEDQEEQYRMTKYNIDIINRKCHDLKHQIRAMRMMDSQEEREKILAELEHAVMIYDSTIKTGNTALDVLLTEKSLLCEKENINFTCVVDASCLEFMGIVDIYTLFGNAIDNALECVRRYQDPAQKQVALNIGKKGNLISIKLENYCDIELSFHNGLPQSTKENSDYHGFGTQSIRYIVEKYGGILRMKQENDMFSMDILFEGK